MDERLRGRERRAATGDTEARALLLADRLRTGDVTKKRLEMAAALGDKEAAVAIGKEADSLRLLDEDPSRWLRDLSRLKSRELFMRLVRQAAEQGFREAGDLPADAQEIFSFIDRWILASDPDRKALYRGPEWRSLWPRTQEGDIRSTSSVLSRLLHVADPTDDGKWDHGSTSASSAMAAMHAFDLNAGRLTLQPFPEEDEYQDDVGWIPFNTTIATPLIAKRIKDALPAVTEWLEGGRDVVREGVEARERAKAAEEAKKQQEKAAEDARKVIDEKME